MTISEYLENLIDQCGGLNRYQALLIFGTLGAKLTPTWSMLMMTFAGVIPDWNCDSFISVDNATQTSQNNSKGNTSDSTFKMCKMHNQTCRKFTYENNMDTIVREVSCARQEMLSLPDHPISPPTGLEVHVLILWFANILIAGLFSFIYMLWDLVCDNDWISDTITTIQMAGLLVSGFFAGHLADSIGRKPSFFLSLVMIMIFNLCAGFSVSWKMFAVFRFLIGFGCGCYLTVFYSFLVEYTPSKHRPIIMGIPSWALWSMVFAFAAKWLHNWQYLHFATAILTVPWLLFWWVFPESFRWLAMHGKIDEAEKTIAAMAKFNRRPVPDLSKLKLHIDEEVQDVTKTTYSIMDLFKTSQMLRVTLLCAIGWISCGYGYYAISFGVESLSGDLYLNMFLLSFVDMPAQISTYFFLNCIGRKKTNVLFFLIAGIGGVIVGVIQVTNTPNKDSLINGFALVSKLGVAAGWASLQIITAENYPTVIRNIGYGAHNSISRIGAMVAPQVVYLNKHLSGVLYFLFGGVMLLTALSVAFVPETKDKVMPDNIANNKKSNLQLQTHNQMEYKF